MVNGQGGMVYQKDQPYPEDTYNILEIMGHYPSFVSLEIFLREKWIEGT